MMKSFIFDPSKGETPETLAHKRAVIDAMLRGATGRAPSSVGEGIAAIGQAIAGRLSENEWMAAQKRGMDSAAVDFAPIASMFGGGASAAGVQTSGDVPAGNLPDDMAAYRDAITGIESGGKYDAIGPTTKTGDRAYGRYQVMGANVPQWTQEALGRSMTPQEFLADRKAQDAVFDHIFGGYVKQYGPEGAAQAWFGGPGSIGKLDRKDVLGTSVGGYGKQFMAALAKRGAGGQPVEVASLDPSAGVAEAASAPAGNIPAIYSKIPKLDGRGEDQIAKFMQWNSDPVGNQAANLASLDPQLAKVIQRAQELSGTKFVLGSGKRDEAMQKLAQQWGWSNTDESDHLGGGAADLWPLDDSGAVVFDPTMQAQIADAMRAAGKELGINLDIGADWKHPDRPHFAIKGGDQVASLDPAAGVPAPAGGDQVAGLRIGGLQPQPVNETAPATVVADGLDGNSPIIRALLGQSGADPTNPNGVFPSAPSQPQPGDIVIQQLMRAAQNPWLNEGQQAVVKAMLGEEMKKRDPAAQLELKKMQIELDRLEHPVMSPYEAAQVEAGKVRDAMAADKAKADAADTAADNAREEKRFNLDVSKFDYEKQKDQLPEFYDAYVKQEQAAGRQPLGILDFITATKKAGAQNITIGGEPNDGALRKKLDEKTGENWAAFSELGATSAAMAQDMQVLDELIKVAPQGPITGRLAEAFPGVSSAGDAFQSIVKRIAPTLRAPGSGATSDIEYEGMLKSLPALGNRPEANAAIAALIKAKAAINVERADIIDKYGRGEISAGEARSQIAELNKRSILSPDLKQMIGGLGGDSGAGEQGLPDGVTEEDVQHTMKLHGLTREQVLEKLLAP